MTTSIVSLLNRTYPSVKCALNFRNVWGLTVAVILSAQCTDVRVNKVTAELFLHYNTIADFVNLPLAKLEKLIYSTGFYKNKAKNIKQLAEILHQKYHDIIPDEMDELVQLPGIGRKTANVILGDGFQKSVGIVVDTHVLRVCYRLGLTTQRRNAVITERELIKTIPVKEWYGFSHRVIRLGREYCDARKPRCSTCPLSKVCKKRMG